MKIILIDDDADDAELFTEAILAVHSMAKVDSFSGGRDALNALDSMAQKPSIIFLDLNMPRMSGKEVLKDLRSKASTDGIPVVIYSTTISKKDIDDTSPYQVKAYLQKPDSFTELCRELSNLLP